MEVNRGQSKICPFLHLAQLFIYVFMSGRGDYGENFGYSLWVCERKLSSAKLMVF